MAYAAITGKIAFDKGNSKFYIANDGKRALHRFTRIMHIKVECFGIACNMEWLEV